MPRLIAVAIEDPTRTRICIGLLSCRQCPVSRCNVWVGFLCYRSGYPFQDSQLFPSFNFQHKIQHKGHSGSVSTGLRTKRDTVVTSIFARIAKVCRDKVQDFMYMPWGRAPDNHTASCNQLDYVLAEWEKKWADPTPSLESRFGVISAIVRMRLIEITWAGGHDFLLEKLQHLVHRRTFIWIPICTPGSYIQDCFDRLWVCSSASLIQYII